MRGAIVGIDIGTTRMTTVVARPEKDGKFRVIGVGSSPSAGVRRGAVIDAEAASAALRRSVHEASRSSGAPVRSALVAIGGSHIGAFPIRGTVAVSRADGEVTEDDVRRVVYAAEGLIPRNPNREVIHVIPRQFRVDGEGGLTDPVGMAGMKLDVEALVIDSAKPALSNLIKCCELAGIEIEDWVSVTLAASEVLLTAKQKELGVMLLDLGAGTSDFAVFEEGQVLDVGSFPIGGSHITSDIAIGFKTQVAAAEAIKVRHASALAEAARGGRREAIRLADFSPAGGEEAFLVRDLTDIVAARLTDIFELAVKALKKVGRNGLLPGGVVLAGGVADIPGIQELARRELALPVEVAKGAALEEFADVVPPRLAVPVGLMRWRMRQEGGWRGGSRRWGGLAERLKRVLRSFVP